MPRLAPASDPDILLDGTERHGTSRSYEQECMDADVIVAGTGPLDLVSAGEFRLTGVRSLVLERQPRPRGTPDPGGPAGRPDRVRRSRPVRGRGARRREPTSSEPADTSSEQTPHPKGNDS